MDFLDRSQLRGATILSLRRARRYFPVLHLVLAVGVTGHILVHKRDPGSAVAWIGIAWLSPVLGSLL